MGRFCYLYALNERESGVLNASIGMIEVEGVAGIIRAADASAKASRIEHQGWESIGGYTTLFFTGDVSEVEAAIRAGEAAARGAIDHVVCNQLTRADDAVQNFIDIKPHTTDVSTSALGIVEARGYGRHVPRNDAMVKAANVQVLNVLTVMSRVVCSLVVGNVGDVRESVRVAQSEIPDENLMSATVISRPHESVFGLFAPEGASS